MQMQTAKSDKLDLNERSVMNVDVIIVHLPAASGPLPMPISRICLPPCSLLRATDECAVESAAGNVNSLRLNAAPGPWT